MKRARFIAAARLEFLAEVIYHSEAQPGLGERFTAAVEEATARALAFPLSGSPSRSKTRRIVGDKDATAFWSREYRPGWEPKV